MLGAVTASSQAAADTGAAALCAGGNAVDAIVTAALASCVADPCNTGLGGYGGYLLVQRASQPALCVQFPACPPSSMSDEALQRVYPEEGPACSTVPNVVGGLAQALRTFGTFSWSEVSAPAIRLAGESVKANATTRRAFWLHRSRAFMDECFVFEETRDGDLLFRQPQLARTLERMAEKGPEWFYSGPIGSAAHSVWRRAGVGISLEDWPDAPQNVDVVAAPALLVEGVRIQAAPLGLSGSACLFAVATAAARIASLATIDGLAELAVAIARVWQHRFSMPSGNDFSGIDLKEWVEVSLESRTTLEVQVAQTGHTAHLNAVDSEGMIAALTFTHGPAWFGGRWVIPGTGVIMNGGMHNFTRPGLVHHKGRRFGVSNMTPTIADTSDGVRIALGCPGARRIPTNIALALARHCFGREPLQAAVSAGRIHTEEMSTVYFEEDRLGAAVGRALSRRFEFVKREENDNYFGPLTAIRYACSGSIEAAVDDRETPGFLAYAH
jgi:gamma-glutamyltranspeptidase / glutathione hydrolase